MLKTTDALYKTTNKCFGNSAGLQQIKSETQRATKIFRHTISMFIRMHLLNPMDQNGRRSIAI
jgi:hypothetical protein